MKTTVKLLEELREKITEIDKLFKNSPELLKIYTDILKDETIEVNGMQWPIRLLIDATSNNNAMKAGELSEKVLRYFVDFVIDAVLNITDHCCKPYDDNTHLFLLFLSEIKFRGVHSFFDYCYDLSVIIASCASDTDKWREKVYDNGLFRELAIELAESLLDVKKICNERKKVSLRQD